MLMVDVDVDVDVLYFCYTPYRRQRDLHLLELGSYNYNAVNLECLLHSSL